MNFNKDNKQIMGISNSRGYVFIALDEILFLKADSSYTEIYMVDGKKYSAVKLLKYFERELEANHFIRVHQSYVVNMLHLSKYLNRDQNTLELVTGDQIPVSRSRKKELMSSFIRA